MSNFPLSRKSISILLLLLILIISVLHYIASALDLYFTIWWYDIPMHILGGMFSAILSLWVYFFSSFFKNQKWDKKTILRVILIGTAFVGVSWEIYEFVLGLTANAFGSYPFDTIKDILDDFIGALVVYFSMKTSLKLDI
jgi:uncharacterized BrkB/YihY/UPF0761 family membrane protein